MLERLSKDASQLHEDMILQLHQMQDTVRYTFFECFLALSGKCYSFRIGTFTNSSLKSSGSRLCCYQRY